MKNRLHVPKRRDFLKTVFGTAAGLFGMQVLSGCATGKRKPNILLIFSDDQGIGDVSCYGGDIQTPNIDSIAQNGVKFDDYYVSGPVCTPSRYGLMTGRYPIRASNPVFLRPLMPGQDNDVSLDPEEVTVADILKSSGYKTALVGKWHLGHGSIEFGPLNHGFDHFYGFLPGCVDFYKHTYRTEPAWYKEKELIEEEGYATDLLTDDAIRFIEDNKDVPFFLYLAYNAPHYGKAPEGNLLQAPKEFHEKNPNATDREVYTEMVKSMDEGIGKVLETLKRLKLEEDTLVIFISDNGGPLNFGADNGKYKGQKGNLWEGGIKVPCMMQWKGKIKSGTVTEQIATNADIMPILTGITGAKLPGRLIDGIDISDVIIKAEPKKDRSIIFKTSRGDIAYIDGDWKYLYEEKDKADYLFNLSEDPYENSNLASSMPDKVQEMKEKLKKELNKKEV